MDCTDILPLVIPHLNSKVAVVGCSLVSQHIRSVVLADIQQRFHELLLEFMRYEWDGIGTHGMPARRDARALQWFCSSAGRERMACPETALTVLTGSRRLSMHKERLGLLVEAGLCLTDEAVMQAAARRVTDLKQLVSQILDVTRPGKQQKQHRGLSDGVKHILFVQDLTPDNLEVHPKVALSSSARWLAGAVHTMCNRPVAGDDQDTREGFQLLLEKYTEQATQQHQQHRHHRHQQQQHKANSSRTNSASTSSQAGASGGQHRDLLSLPMHEVLLHVLHTCIIRSRADYVAEVVAAVLHLPADKQPGPHACAELLSAVGAGNVRCIPALLQLPAVHKVPHFAYLSLLKEGGSWLSYGAPQFQALLALPQARDVTAAQLSALLLCCLDPPRQNSVALLLAAAALDSQQVLQLFKAATKYDGAQEAKHRRDTCANAHPTVGSDSEEVEEQFPTVALATLAPLAERLTEQGVVELLQMAADNKWSAVFEAMLQNNVTSDKLSPASFLAVLRGCTAQYTPSTFGALLCTRHAAHLPPDLAYEALQVLSVLADTASAIRTACRVTTWADQLTTAQLMDLLQLALQRNSLSDINSLCVSAPAAKELGPECVLQLAMSLFHAWKGLALTQAWKAPPMYAEVWRVVAQEVGETIKLVLGLPAASALGLEERDQLAAAARQTGDMAALELLLSLLPDFFEPRLSSPELLLLISSSFLQWESGTHPLLMRKQVTAQLSTGDLLQLLLCLMPKATQVSGVSCASFYDGEAVWATRYAAETAQKEEAARSRMQEQRLCDLLDLLLPARQLTTGDMMVLLRCSVSHGLLKVAQKLLGLSMGRAEVQDGVGDISGWHAACGVPAGQASQQFSSRDLLDRGELHELLLCCARLDIDQLYGGCKLKLELFECLLGRAALYGFDGASACSLVVALIAGFPWDHFKTHEMMSMAENKASKGLDHPVMQLLRLPSLEVLDAGVMCAVLDACIADVPMDYLVQDVLQLPAAAQLSVDHIRQLAQACLSYRNAKALRMILQHPAAPSADDPEVQLLNGMLCVR